MIRIVLCVGPALPRDRAVTHSGMIAAMVIDSSLSIPAEQIADFCRRHGIVELALFGSAARGEMRPESDVDVMVTFVPDARWDLYDYAEMQGELELIFHRSVDLVEKGTISNPYRRRSIIRDLTVVYTA